MTGFGELKSVTLGRANDRIGAYARRNSAKFRKIGVLSDRSGRAEYSGHYRGHEKTEMGATELL